MKGLATDESSFENIIRDGALYVDKTAYIWNLVSSKTKRYFLSRPRRFGKTLTVYTLKAFFQGKKDLFRGLAIEKLAAEAGYDWAEHPVIHLDMTRIDDFSSIDRIMFGMCEAVRGAAAANGVKVAEATPGIMFQRLISALQNKMGKDVVVLIDEYDKPILETMQTPIVTDAVNLCRGFYSTVKSFEADERFVFVTGVSKFSHVSLFSDTNLLTDITAAPAYATMLGYTKRELRENFAEHLEAAATANNLSVEDMVDALKLWYDGFHFVADTDAVFNPISVGKFFNGGYRLSNYWYDTGNPKFLIDRLKNDPFTLEGYTRGFRSPLPYRSVDIKEVNPLSLAIESGYLTIKEWRRDDVEYEVRYGLPNYEISQSWHKDMMSLAAGVRDDDPDTVAREMRGLLREGDMGGFMERLDQLLASAAYDHSVMEEEGNYRNYISLIFSLVSIPHRAEDMTSCVRADLVAFTRERAVVIELKIAKSKKRVPALLKEALSQAAEKRYADKYRTLSKEVLSVGLVIDAKTRRLADWGALGI